MLKGASKALVLLFTGSSRGELKTPCLLSCRVTIRCTYPLSGLHRLFSLYKFDSETVGVGQIVHSARFPEGLWYSNINHYKSFVLC